MPSSEFPNDNPALHDGAIWVSHEPCGELEIEIAAPQESVDAKVIDRPSMILPAGTHVREEHDEHEHHEEPRSVTLAELVTELGIEIEDGIVIEELEDFDAPASTPAVDPFSSYVATLADVLRGAGDARAASALPALLCDGLLDADTISGAALDALRDGAFVERGENGPMVSARSRAVAVAWCRVLRGESDDIAACGAATLDEWSADLLARLLGAPNRAALIRRELRSRGIAAFGLAFAA